MKNFIKKITLKEGITIYLKWKQSHTTSAYNKYRVRLEHFENYLKESKNKINLNEITPDDIVDFHNHMTKAYSPATVAYSARILKNFFDFHKGRDHTRVNPKEIISVRFLNADKEVVDQEDFDLMMELLNEVYLLELQKKLVLSLLWDTGMRVSELLDLDISHINDQGKSGLRTAKIKTKKTMRYNLVVWGSKTNGLLNQYLAWRLMVNHPTDALFISTYDRTGSLKRLSSRTIQRWVKELSKEAMTTSHLWAGLGVGAGFTLGFCFIAWIGLSGVIILMWDCWTVFVSFLPSNLRNFSSNL